MKSALWLFPALAVLSAAAYAAQPVTADFIDGKGDRIGTATLATVNGGTLITVDAHLPEGAHAIHIHDNASCAAPDFKSAGGHFGAQGKQPEFSGDLGNLYVEPDGHIKQEIFSPQLHLQGKDGLLHGASIVIHAHGDDYGVSAAAAGGRIACAAIRP